MVKCGTPPTVSHWVALSPSTAKMEACEKEKSLVRVAWLFGLGVAWLFVPSVNRSSGCHRTVQGRCKARKDANPTVPGQPITAQRDPDTNGFVVFQTSALTGGLLKSSVWLLVMRHASVPSPWAVVSLSSSQKLLSPQPLKLKQSRLLIWNFPIF